MIIVLYYYSFEVRAVLTLPRVNNLYCILATIELKKNKIEVGEEAAKDDAKCVYFGL